MKKSRLLSVLSAYALMFASLPLGASVIYTYTGNYFDEFTDTTGIGPEYDASMRVQGIIELASPLSPDLTMADVTPISYAFHDGVNIVTETGDHGGQDIFRFSTDGTGSITEWDVTIPIFPPSPVSAGDIIKASITRSSVQDTVDLGFTGTYFDSTNYAVDLGSIDGSPGSWCTGDGCPSFIPIPPALWLFCSGLLGLTGMARRNKIT